MAYVVLEEAGVFAPGEGPGEGNVIAALLQSDTAFDVVERSKQSFVIEGTAGSGFEGWRLVIDAGEASTFDYQHGLPTGWVASAQLFDADGQLVLTMPGLGQLDDLHDWAQPGFFASNLHVEGSDGADHIIADPSQTYPWGPTIFGGGGDDTIEGAGQMDTLDGGDGDDVIHGGGRWDLLTGDAGDDALFGDSGYATLIGGLGNDSLYGGAQGGELDGGAGVNLMIGGAGADTFISHGKDHIEGGGGDDHVLIYGAGDKVRSVTIDGGDGYNYVDFEASVGKAVIYVNSDRSGAGYHIDNVSTINLNEAGATVYVGESGAAIWGGNGVEHMFGGAGGDTLWGETGADLIRGGGGNDLIEGGGGARLYGQDGDDTFLVTQGDATVAGGAGFDKLEFADGPDTAIRIDLTAKGVQHTGWADLLLTGVEGVTGGGGDDTLVGGEGANALVGNGGNDRLIGAGGDDTLDGGYGSDTLIGGDGDDQLTTTGYGAFDSAVSELSGGRGDDTFNLASFNYEPAIAKVHGGAGVDTLMIGAAGETEFDFDPTSGLAHTGNATIEFDGIENFWVFGGGADDTIHGGAGADTLFGSMGDDLVLGGKGDDVLMPGYGADTISGGKGFDVLDFSWTYGVSISLADGGAQALPNGASVQFTSIEGIYGTYFEGDTLIGDAGANLLDGRSGDDVLDGGAGADTIMGGTGADTLTGGDGADIFRYASAEDSTANATDTVTDLASDDVIDLSQIDANTNLDGDQSFRLVSAFDGHAGELVLSMDPGAEVTLLQADLDGDGAADMVVRLAGLHSHFDHFVL